MRISGKEIKQRVIPRNNRSFTPHQMIFLDTESDWKGEEVPVIQNFRIAWALYYRRRIDGAQDRLEWKFFYRDRDLCRWIASKARKDTVLWLFGHNILYDLQLSSFFQYFTYDGWKLDFLYENGLSFILSISKDDRTIKALSTTNFFPVSLESLGKLLGYPKEDIDFKDASLEKLSHYCRRDVEIIYKVMTRYFDFLREHDLGQFSFTRASQSFNAFRHRFMDHRIYVHREPEVINLEKEAYFGGRVECFHLGKIDGGPFVSLDVNAMYPYVMREFNYPVQFISFNDHYPFYMLEEDLKHNLAIAEALIETDVPRYAVRLGKKLIFPVGNFTAFLTTEGLKRALRDGHLKGIVRIAFYRGAPIFKKFVDYFYSLRTKYRSEGNIVYAEMVKVVMNSLYGKFAQYRPILEITPDDGPPDFERIEEYGPGDDEHWIITRLFNVRIEEKGRELAPFSSMAIASHITENARMVLDDIISSVGRDRVLYCDTDSLIIRKEDLNRVNYPLNDGELGSLKIDKEGECLIINAPKDYLLGSFVKRKGVPAQAVEIGRDTYSYITFPRLKTYLREGAPAGVRPKKVIKKLSKEYNKGIVERGGRVMPYQLEWW
jgi:hypothetical protein